MTDLTVNTFYRVERFGAARFLVTNGVTIKKGAYVGLASTGLAGPLSTGTYSTPTGMIADQEVTGDGSTIYVTGFNGGEILRGVTVVGLAAATDQGAVVYMTDDHVFTLSSSGSAVKVGRVVEVVDATNAKGDVLLYSFEKLGS